MRRPGLLLIVIAYSSAFVLPSSLIRRSAARGARFDAVASVAVTSPLLDAIEAAGVVGIDASEEDQARCESEASALSDKAPSNVAAARVPLMGTYDLLYSMAKGGSNGKVGPFVGKVSQIVLDDKVFVNQVELFGGFVTVQLYAEREVLDDQRIRVSFVETVFRIYGAEVSRKPTQGSGVWTQLYVEPGPGGSAAFRVMNTPSLFVLRQRLSKDGLGVDRGEELVLPKADRARYLRTLEGA